MTKNEYQNTFHNFPSFTFFKYFLFNSNEITINGEKYHISNIKPSMKKGIASDLIRKTPFINNRINGIISIDNLKSVIKKIEEGNNDYLTENIDYVFLLLLTYSHLISFNMVSLTNKITLSFPTTDIYKLLFEMGLIQFKLALKKILKDDPYRVLIDYIDKKHLSLLMKISNGEFLNKNYSKEFIKAYISIVPIALPIDIDPNKFHLLDTVKFSRTGYYVEYRNVGDGEVLYFRIKGIDKIKGYFYSEKSGFKEISAYLS